MKNILQLIETSETGGAERLFAELAVRLDRTRFRPVPGVIRQGWLVQHLRERGCEPALVPAGRGGFDLGLLRGLCGLIRRQRIDLVHAHLFGAGVYASLAGTLAGVPVIATLHGTMDVAGDDPFRRAKWLILNRLARTTVFVSRSLERHFVAAGLAATGRNRVIYNGIDSERFRPAPERRGAARTALGLAPEHFVVGCVGDLRPAKDYATALRAAALLRESIPGFRMLVAGTPTALGAELEELRVALDLTGCVTFLGYRPRMETIYPAFDLYLSTSRSEGFSLTVAEALACALPAVATRSGGPEEILSDGETGLLVPPGEARAIAAAVLRLHRDRAAAGRMAAAGRRMVAGRFSLQAMVGNYQDLYEEVGRGKVSAMDPRTAG